MGRKKTRAASSADNSSVVPNASRQVPQQQPASPSQQESVPEEQDTWSCQFCTFENSIRDHLCSICEASRDGSQGFAEQVLPVEQHPQEEEEPERSADWEVTEDFEEHKRARGRQKVKTIWVGGLQDDWLEEDLSALFPTATMTKMVYDQGSAGTYGFVEFTTREEAQMILDTKKNKPIPGMEWRKYQLNWGTKNLDERWGAKRVVRNGTVGAVQLASPEGSVPCKYFLQGKCVYGEKCKNLHQVIPAAPAPALTQRAVSPQPSIPALGSVDRTQPHPSSIGYKSPETQTHWPPANDPSIARAVGPPRALQPGAPPQVQPLTQAQLPPDQFSYGMPSVHAGSIFECFQPSNSGAGFGGLFGHTGAFGSTSHLNLPAHFYEPANPGGSGGQQAMNELLDTLGLEHLSERFGEEEIDCVVLKMMSDHDLKELGLCKGPRMKLCKWIAENK